MKDNDKAGRYLIKRDAVGFLRWLFQQPSIDFRGWIDTRRVVLPDQGDLTHDLIAACATDGEVEAYCVELESESSADSVERLLSQYVPRLVYEPSQNGLKLSSVNGIVINLTGPPQPDSISHQSKLLPKCRFEGVIAQFTLREMSASTLLADVASGLASIWLLAWLPLMDGGEESAIIEGWKQNALRLPVERDRGILVTLTLTFATLVGNLALWNRELEGWNVITNPYLEEIRDEARTKLLLDTIARLGTQKFGKAPTKKQRTTLNSTHEIAKLERMIDRVLTASTWDDLLSTP